MKVGGGGGRKETLADKPFDFENLRSPKKWTIMFGCYLQKTKRFLHVISSHSSFNLFKKVCERSWRQLQPIARKKDLISMYRGALVSGFCTFWPTLTNQRIIFKPLDRFFKKFNRSRTRIPYKPDFFSGFFSQLQKLRI